MAITRNGKLCNFTEIKKNTLSFREQGDLKNKWLKKRFETILPMIMKETGIDTWIIATREYNEDPVIMTMLPSPAINAFGRPVIVFHLEEDGTVTRYYVQRRADIDFPLYTTYASAEMDQFKGLREIIDKVQPKRIGVNFSLTDNHCDGIGHGDFINVQNALGEEWMKKVESAEPLAVRWLETRLPEELAAYETICHISHSIIDEAFSKNVIVPGVTTPLDVEWWIREKMWELNMPPWFVPNIQINRPGAAYYNAISDETVIMPGDVLWSDFGLEYLGLHTDQQEIAYVLRPGETDAPEGIKNALKVANHVQDAVYEEIKLGRTGNEVLMSVFDRMNKEGIRCSIYCHPIGYHGHGAGPCIGSYEILKPRPGAGDRVIYDNTVHSMELYAWADNIPEWNGEGFRVMLEQEIKIQDGKVSYVDGRQTELHLI